MHDYAAGRRHGLSGQLRRGAAGGAGPVVLVRPTSDRSVPAIGRRGARGRPRPARCRCKASRRWSTAPRWASATCRRWSQQLRGDSGVRASRVRQHHGHLHQPATASRAVRLDAEAAVQSSQLDWTLLRPTMIYGTARDRNISRLLRFVRRCAGLPAVRQRPVAAGLRRRPGRRPSSPPWTALKPSAKTYNLAGAAAAALRRPGPHRRARPSAATSRCCPCPSRPPSSPRA